MPRRLIAAAAATVVAGLLLPAAPALAGGDTVTISGKAYRFNHMDTYIAGATIRVRELPNRTAVTDANGDYALEVPDDTTVTPYIDPPEPYNEIDLQTFHTRGEDIENANFQTPHDDEYNALAAILGVEMGPDGRPLECVVVSTVSARDVRGVPYETFHERTPHGVPGATARGFPAVPGPVYFNENVIPDRSETETSEDGGVLWEAVPDGPHRFVASHPQRRFASFLATCEPGRIVNANPPWGLYELTGKEKPLGAGIVAGSLAKVRAKRAGGGPRVAARLDLDEALDVVVELRRRGKKLASERADNIIGTPKVTLQLDSAPSGRAKVIVRMRDAAGDEVSDSARVELP